MTGRAAKTRPRIAFFGGMANNCYVAARALHAEGFDVVYIRDRMDSAAISQPMWEDARFTLPYLELRASLNWTPEDWDRLAALKGWTAPDWVIDPIDYHEDADPIPGVLPPGVPLTDYMPGMDHFRQTLALLRTCDLVFVSNAYPMMFALASGVPHVICPAGGEFMMAAGLVKAEGELGVKVALQTTVVTKAFKTATAIISSSSMLSNRALTGGLWNLLKIIGHVPYKSATLTFPIRSQLSAEEKRPFLNAVLADLEVEPITTRFAVFVPSRIDYQWKGQDKILEALSLARSSADFTVIFAGWGADYEHFVDRTAKLKNIRVLKHAVSKPLIYDLSQGADLTIDQFTLGQIGSAAYEAAAVGAAVMAWVERRPGWFPVMPIINVRTAAQIAATFDKIAEGSISLPKLGAASQAWMLRHGSGKHLGVVLMQCLNLARRRGDYVRQAPVSGGIDPARLSDQLLRRALSNYQNLGNLIRLYGPSNVVCYDYWSNAGATVDVTDRGAKVVTPPVAYHYAAGIHLDYSGLTATSVGSVRVRIGDVEGQLRIGLYNADEDRIVEEQQLDEGGGVREVILPVSDLNAHMLMLRSGPHDQSATAIFVGAEILRAESGS